MSQHFASAIAAGAMAAATLGLASVAQAAPSGPAQVETTVKALEDQGFTVILSRSGTAPLSACSITSVTPGHTYSTFDSRGDSSPNETVQSMTVIVDVAC